MKAVTQQLLEDLESLPPEMQAEALDFVHFLKTKLAHSKAVTKGQTSKSREATAIMSEIAVRGTAFQDIGDPLAWQRQERLDRVLPGRD
ncbi:MAG: hypothetical protein ACU837_06075 [Gammaproteobacteria bacterium]